MRILGIYPHIGDGTRKAPTTKRYFPWGFATVMRCLEISGHTVEILDIYGKDLLPHDVEEYLSKHRYDCVCISGFASYNYSHVLWLAKTVKSFDNIPVIVGGILADHHYKLLLSKNTIDFCVLGEGEITIVDLLNHLSDPGNVRGIAFRQNGNIIVTPPRELIKDLDTLPMPNFDVWDMGIYLTGGLWADDKTTQYEYYYGNLPKYEDLHPNIAMFFGRGCPYRCRFCSRSYPTIRHKSTDRIVNEVKFLKEKFGIKAVHFYDELVVFNKEIIIDLSKKLKDLNIYWDCQARVNLMNYDLMKILKDSNCYSLGFGFESGSDALLKAMNKGIRKEQNLRVLEDARKIGMHLKIQLMCGYPGETEDTINETVEMMKACKLPPRRMSWTTPLPGSYIYSECVEKGLIPDEEEYLIRLGKMTMNSEGNIILNISGLSDDIMEDLFIRANNKMNYNFYCQILKENVKNAFSFQFIRKFLISFILSNKVLCRNIYVLRKKGYM
jgi:anaerobic magnesium-protoporphyrin IX monomethyl ester cyclase